MDDVLNNDDAFAAGAPATADDREDAEIVAGLGTRLRALRKEQGLTLQGLAERSGVSRAMLSKMERSEKVPTLSTIVRVAKGLNMTLSSLLGAQPDASAVSVLRARDRIVYRDPQTGFEREALSPAHVRQDVEIVRHRLPPGRSTGWLPSYPVPTEKYVLVQAGTLTAEVDGKAHILEAGDTLFFAVTGPYRFTNEAESETAYLVVMVRRAAG